MGTVIWRDIRAHLKRFVLTALAVTLGVAFLSGTLGIRDVLRSTFSSLIDGLVTDGLLVSGPVVAETGFGALHGPIDPALAETILRRTSRRRRPSASPTRRPRARCMTGVRRKLRRRSRSRNRRPFVPALPRVMTSPSCSMATCRS